MRFLLSLALLLSAACAYAQTPAPQEESPASQEASKPASPDVQSQSPNPAQTQSLDQTPSQAQSKPQIPPPSQSDKPATAPDSSQSATKPADQTTPSAGQQPQRILGVMPNFRAVSAGALPPPPTPKEAFIIATQNTFDYSSFIFTGLTSALAEGTDTHPQLGKGMPGFGRYYWRGFVDKADGNYLVLFALPTVLHEDERYYAMGKGGFWKRFIYSTTRVLITPNYEGHNTFNASEFLGRGIAQAVSVSYYPSQTRTAGAVGAKFGYAILRDAATNAFREFWPDIAIHVLHRHP